MSGKPKPRYTVAALDALAGMEPNQYKKIRNPWSDPKKVACFRAILHKKAREAGFELRIFKVGDELHLLRVT